MCIVFYIYSESYNIYLFSGFEYIQFKDYLFNLFCNCSCTGVKKLQAYSELLLFSHYLIVI